MGLLFSWVYPKIPIQTPNYPMCIQTPTVIKTCAQTINEVIRHSFAHFLSAADVLTRAVIGPLRRDFAHAQEKLTIRIR